MHRLSQMFLNFPDLQSATDLMKAAECVVPRILNSVPFFHYDDTTTCPKILDNGAKKYCCLNTDFQVECCDIVQYVIFGLVFEYDIRGKREEE